MSKENALTQTLAPALITERPAYIKEDSSRGNENMTRDDVAIPILMQCQALSKALKKKEADYIDGIEEGDLYNSVTREVYGPAVDICFVGFKAVHAVWKAGTTTGAYRGTFDTLEEAEAARFFTAQEEKVDPSAFQIVKTHQHLALLVTQAGAHPVMLNMSGTKMKTSKNINSLVAQFGGDRFARLYKLCSVETSNDKGTFQTLKVMPCGFVTESVYRAAEKLHEMRDRVEVAAPESEVDVEEAPF